MSIRILFEALLRVKRVAGRRFGLRAPLVVLALVAAALEPAMAQPSSQCGRLENGYGPYDYRSDRDKLPIVEGAHFTVEVESLVRSVTGYLGGDIDYTLRAFPNHHRALDAMMRLGERLRVAKAPNATYEVECYFVRAIRFRSDDAIVRQLYAVFLGRKQRKDEAMRQLEAARILGADNGFTRYNIGMIYMDLGEPALALAEAHAAAAAGFERPELRDRLVAVGKWVEPAPSAPPPMAPSASRPTGTMQ